MKITCNIPTYEKDGVKYVTIDDVCSQTEISRQVLGDYAKKSNLVLNPFSFFPLGSSQGILNNGTITYTQLHIIQWESILPIVVNQFNYAIQFFLAFAKEKEKIDYEKGDYLNSSNHFGIAYLTNAYLQVESNVFFDDCDEFEEMVDAKFLEHQMGFKTENWLSDPVEGKKVMDLCKATGYKFDELIQWKNDNVVRMHHIAAVYFCKWVDPNLGNYLEETFEDVIDSIYDQSI